jgi:hypothetical protein
VKPFAVFLSAMLSRILAYWPLEWSLLYRTPNYSDHSYIVYEVQKMSEHERKHEKMESEEIKEVLGAISTEVPGLIKSVLSSVFSEEAGRSMGKAAAAYYKELKDGGLPEQVAVKMTEDYMRTFTSIGDMLRSSGKGGWSWSQSAGDEIGSRIKENINKGLKKRNEEEE